MKSYNPADIEPRWQAAWEEEGLYRGDDQDTARPRFYALDMFPYPSGDLHMGHAEVYAIGDVIARYHTMRGYNVLHPIGWDAFGLPAENAAISRGIHPKQWTDTNIDQQRRSFKRYGVSFDWSRQFNTCDPEYYRWTQWLFIAFFKRGLAYRRLAPANWCPKDQTVLANEQVVNGCCERCDTPVVRRDLTQWFFRITDYADRLLDDMTLLEGGWSERVLSMQRNWIGRSEGAELEFEVAETSDRIMVFTTRPDTVWGVTFLAFAPEHPLLERLAETGGSGAAVKDLQDRLQRMSPAERDVLSREGVPLGVHAVNPVNGERVPCLVAPYVLMDYGTGAVMGVPAHDQRDLEFARQHGLPVRVVIEPDDGRLDAATLEHAFTDQGHMVGSGPFAGQASPQCIPDVIRWLAAEGRGRAAVSYRLRDWLISRQRYWGAPIPIVHCGSCGEVAVPESDLPVLLPDDVDISPFGQSPLARNAAFVEVACPSCGGAGRRETDTMDTFVDSSWYFFRYCSPGADDAPFHTPDVERWMPVTQYTGGINHAVLHLLYSRFFTKVLHDLGMISFAEPCRRLLNQGMVLMNGMAMSKSRGNLVVFADELARHGADVMRVTVLFAGPVEDDVDWATVSPTGINKWLGRVWRAVHAAAAGDGGAAAADDDLERALHSTIRQVTEDMEGFRFNVAVSRLMSLTSALQRAAERGVASTRLRQTAEALVLMLAPMAPFVAEELWRVPLAHPESVHRTGWPAFDPGLATALTVTMVVQVDGRVRDRVEVPPEATEEDCRRIALSSAKTALAMAGREIARVVVRPPRVVNIVTTATTVEAPA